MIAWEESRNSGGNAATPSRVDMNRKTRPRPAMRRRHAQFRCAVRNNHTALAVSDESPRMRGVGGPRLRAGRRRETPAWTGIVSMI